VSLRERYQKDVVPVLMDEFAYGSAMQVPRLTKIVVNIGLGEALANAKVLESASRDLSVLTGQKPVITKARKSIASFKLREGNPIGAKVTLRGQRMYDFLERLIRVALPRSRDFRGVSADAFDGRGNYLSGDRLQRHRQDPRSGADDRHDGGDGRRGAADADVAWHAVSARIASEDTMAKTSIKIRETRRKYPTRVRNRCMRCGRPRGYMRKFRLCRICFRRMALEGLIPGVVKSSW
jgi:large subunit ribosomal protein L5